MLIFILVSALLSLTAWVIFRAVRAWMSYEQQRLLLLALIGASLVLPLTVTPQLPSPLPTAHSIWGGFSSAEENELRMLCACESPNVAHRLYYRSNAWINFFLNHKIWVNTLLLLLMGGVFLHGLGQLLYLHRLVRRSKHRKIYVANRPYTLLYPDKQHAVGAFWLGKPYLIHEVSLNYLSETERQAVFAHELSHLRQGNTIEKILLNVIHCIWWFNPAFYLFRRELDLLGELIADRVGSQVLGSRKQYANLLLRLQSGQIAWGVQHFGTTQLQTRIERLFRPTTARVGVWLLALLLTVGLQLTEARLIVPQLNQLWERVHTYETIYAAHPEEESCLYCTECQQLCTPDPAVESAP